MPGEGCPSTRDTSPLVSVIAASRRRHALPGLPASFCQPCAVYIRPNVWFDSRIMSNHRTACPIPTASSARLIGRGRGVMTFEEILDQVIAMLQRRGRVTYRTL